MFMRIGDANNYNYNNRTTPNTNVSKQTPSQAYQPASSNTNGILYACGDMSGKGISVRYDDSSTEDNPVMLVRTVDSKGKETETKINPREINPSKASAAEMAALIAYSRDKGEAQPLNPAMIRIIHDTDDLLEKKDLAGAVKTYANNSINRQSYLDLMNVIDAYINRNAGKSNNGNGITESLMNYGMDATQFLALRNSIGTK